MHALLRPPAGRAEPGLRPGLPDRLDPVRPDRRAASERADARVEQLQGRASSRAYLYGADDKMLGGLNAFYLLVDKPEVYGLPRTRSCRAATSSPSSLFGARRGRGRPAGLFSFRGRRHAPSGRAGGRMMPSTLFTAPPDWGWLIVCYFFLGGIAGGAYFLAALIDLFGRPEDRPLARLGYYVAFPLVVCAAPAHRRPRPAGAFWHMLIQFEHAPADVQVVVADVGRLVGAACCSALLVSRRSSAPSPRLTRPDGRHCALSHPRNPRRHRHHPGRCPRPLSRRVHGRTAAVTNRPIWADTTLLGLTFLISGASTAAAVLILLGWRRRDTLTGLRALERFDGWLLVFELVALIALVFSLGEIARLWLGWWGALLVFGVVGLGIVVPLLMFWRPRTVRATRGPIAAVLVLVGGFLLRVVVILSSEGA